MGCCCFLCMNAILFSMFSLHDLMYRTDSAFYSFFLFCYNVFQYVWHVVWISSVLTSLIILKCFHYFLSFYSLLRKEKIFDNYFIFNFSSDVFVELQNSSCYEPFIQHTYSKLKDLCFTSVFAVNESRDFAIKPRGQVGHQVCISVNLFSVVRHLGVLNLFFICNEPPYHRSTN